MSANVRCAGNGDPRRSIKVPAPCGWRGERFALGDADLWDDPDIRDAQIIVARTARPCPRCGGQVELIEQEVGP